MLELYKLAIQKKYRYPTSKGLVTTEDLLDLPLTSKNGPSLQNTAQTIYQLISENGQPSFVASASESVNVDDKNKLEIVKDIIADRELSNATALKSAENRKLKEQLMGILADKQSEAWKSMSPEKLQEIIATLN